MAMDTVDLAHVSPPCLGFLLEPLTKGMLFSIGGAYLIIFMFTMQETRGSVLLVRSLRRRESKGEAVDWTGIPRRSMSEILWISCTRPLSAFVSSSSICNELTTDHSNTLHGADRPRFERESSDQWSHQS